jgi:uncharacterized protein YfiM (DUF2279 family)
MTPAVELRETARVLRAGAYFMKARWVNEDKASERSRLSLGVGVAEELAQAYEAEAKSEEEAAYLFNQCIAAVLDRWAR